MTCDSAKLYFEFIIFYCNKPRRVVDSGKRIRCTTIRKPLGRLCVFEVSTSGSSTNASVYNNILS